MMASDSDLSFLHDSGPDAELFHDAGHLTPSVQHGFNFEFFAKCGPPALALVPHVGGGGPSPSGWGVVQCNGVTRRFYGTIKNVALSNEELYRAQFIVPWCPSVPCGSTVKGWDSSFLCDGLTMVQIV